jgi:hypothetical protein
VIHAGACCAAPVCRGGRLPPALANVLPAPSLHVAHRLTNECNECKGDCMAHSRTVCTRQERPAIDHALWVGIPPTRWPHLHKPQARPRRCTSQPSLEAREADLDREVAVDAANRDLTREPLRPDFLAHSTYIKETPAGVFLRDTVGKCSPHGAGLPRSRKTKITDTHKQGEPSCNAVSRTED